MSNPNMPSMPPMPAPGGVDPNRNKKMAVYGVLTGIAVCLAIFLGLRASGLLQLRTTPKETNMLQAHADTGPSLLQAHGSPTQPVLNAQIPPSVEMPEDVRDWLEHLRKCEERRKGMAQEHMSQAMITLTMLRGAGDIEMIKSLLEEANTGVEDPNAKTSAQKTMEDADKMRQQWFELGNFFNSKQPPAECVPLRDNYDQVLRETGGMIGDIIGIASGADQDAQTAIKKLQGMVGKSKNAIDKPAQATDEGVSAICAKYKTKKWFGIESDYGGGLLQKLGM